ncbi:MAG: cytochrome c-type biogenesis protein [Ilumatobacteraceae bacterium]
MSRTSKLKRWPAWVLLALVVATFLAYGTAKESGPLTPEERVEEITKRIACPVCDGETVYESANPASAAIRAEVKAQVANGVSSDDEIVAYIVQQFGAQTQLLPKASGFDALVWVLPAAAFVCAGVGLFFAFRRWQRNVDAVPDDDDRARVAAALAEEDEPPPADDDLTAPLAEEAAEAPVDDVVEPEPTGEQGTDDGDDA